MRERGVERERSDFRLEAGSTLSSESRTTTRTNFKKTARLFDLAGESTCRTMAKAQMNL